ncbi:GFA family protein [Acinetobacter brisouii]|uniref:GFA family protein n=1 Tax=Acinetobacter brisouii TaxID=396323 RepID=UPI00124FEC22|nr:GFA family protein [Acinetobacter brisouii]
MSLFGSCLCGVVQFQVRSVIDTIYHCHCGLCRKQTGSGFNAASLVEQSHFSWLQGDQQIRQYQKASGFRSAFCNVCGSCVPNQVNQTSWMWIPLGLLDSEITPIQRLNFCVNSKAAWVESPSADKYYPEIPSFTELKAYFKLD